MGDATKSLAAEIEAVKAILLKHTAPTWIAGQQFRRVSDDAISAVAAEIAALHSRAFEDGDRSLRVDAHVWKAAASLDAIQAAQPEWLWYEHDQGRVSFGRWPRVAGAAPYVRADFALPLQPEGERNA